MRKLLTAVVLFLGSFLYILFGNFYTPVLAQTVTPTTTEITTTSVTGRISKIDGNNITIITDSNSAVEITLANNINIKRNTVPAKISDLQVNDQVTITKGNNNEVLSVQAVAGNVIDWGKFIVPGIIIGLIGLVLLILVLTILLKRGNQGHIKTAVTQTSS